MRRALFAILAACSLAAVSADTITGTAHVSTRSAFVNYGLMMGRDPIIIPAGRVTFGDLLYVSAFSLMDFGDGNGKRAGYTHRARKNNASVGVRHAVPVETVGTFVADLSYMYEYVPRHRGRVYDTQFIHARFALAGRWLEPALHIERDFMLDGGTYVNAEIGHTFAPFDRFTIRPAIAQGFGDGKRTAGCFGDFDSAGLMDTTIRADFAYALTDWLTVGAFVAYHDFWFGDGMRGAAAAFNGRLGHDARTWNFSAGVSISATF